jgi:hypothetical protein
MVDRYWPLGISDMPLREGLTYAPRYLGQDFTTESGEVSTSIRVSDAGVDMTASYVMTNWQFLVFEEWWRKTLRGGILPFWLRDPKILKPFKWRVQPGQTMQVSSLTATEERVTLPLLRLPS